MIQTVQLEKISTPGDIRVLHIAYSGDGGAGRAGRRASMACRTAGITSVFSCVVGADADLGDVVINLDAPAPGSLAAVLKNKLQWGVIPAARVDRGFSLFTIAYPGADLGTLPAVQTADIIHLHWPTWTVTPPQIRRLLDMGKTVFVTLHDMWMFTGGCHYAANCLQYKTACLKCPQVQDRLGLASASFDDKLDSYGNHPNLHVITLCNWMRDAALNSRIFRSSPVHLVPNPVETDVFKPLTAKARSALRAGLGFRDTDLVLLFGAFDSSEHRKGGAILQEAIQLLAKDDRAFAKGRVHLVSFGKNADFAVPERLGYSELGSISKDALLASIYAAADVLCFPSTEDNYPNSIVEAAACGTPSIVFSTGGMTDMVEHGVTGLQVSELGDAAAFAGAIAEFAGSHLGDTAMRSNCRKVTVARNSMVGIGQQLAEAYLAALSPTAAAKPPKTRKKQASTAAATGISASAEIQSHIRVRFDEQLGPRFNRFPVSDFLRKSFAAGQAQTAAAPRTAAALALKPAQVAPPPARVDSKIRLLTVRTFHEHHSAFSGPYQFLRYLGDDYDQTNIVVPLGNDLLPKDLKSSEVLEIGRALGLQGYANQGNAWVSEWDIAQLLHREPFDIVHFIDGELGGWLVSRLPDQAFCGGRRPVLMNMLHQPETILKQMVTIPALKRFDVIGAVAEDQANWLRGLNTGRPVIAVQHGVDTDFFTPPEKKPKNTVFRLVAVGHWLRDYELAIATLDMLAAEGYEFEYRIICHNLFLKREPGYVTRLSGLTDEDLREEYRRADVVFLPLENATANNALLESMACGTPVVSTDVGSVRAYVGEGAGQICAPTPEACAAGLRHLLESADVRRKAGQAGRTYAESLSWQRTAERFDSHYRAALRQKGLS